MKSQVISSNSSGIQPITSSSPGIPVAQSTPSAPLPLASSTSHPPPPAPSPSPPLAPYPPSEAFSALPSRGSDSRKQRKPISVPPPSSTLQVKNWSSLLQKASPPSIIGSLRFIKPSVDGSSVVAKLNPPAYAKNTSQWDQAVVGYIIGKAPVYTPFLQFLKTKWNPKGEMRLLLHGNGFFTVKFSLVEDMNSVLEGGLWTMDHRPFIIRKWSPEVRMEQERLSSIPIWVRLPNLPLHLWEEDSLSRIGSTIGVPLYVDSATLRCTRASYARICVEVQASKVLPDSVLVEVSPGHRESFKLDYDWKPIACRFCQTFGHDEVCCIMKPTSVKAPIANRRIAPVSTSQLKGKEKQTSQWQEVTKARSTSNSKLMANAMKHSAIRPGVVQKSFQNANNKFNALKDCPDHGLIEQETLESKDSTPLEVSPPPKVDTNRISDSTDNITEPQQEQVQALEEAALTHVSEEEAVVTINPLQIPLEGSQQLPEDNVAINLVANKKGGNKKNKQSHNNQRKGTGPKKRHQNGSDLIKDFFKDLADGNPSPKRSASVPPTKGPSSKGLGGSKA
ncbi:hypothetical protein QJS04_geneDACA016571 [Acorus gramineus]|uniref:DUF4283 domain-containing protein n=1 Tax=Acorus gramineus TaxID=55184 RepID=A0AAV9BQI5_ACOGR|nr:hypothetical protein QJS04_geneDACA016571 [Acorus gramineus]